MYKRLPLETLNYLLFCVQQLTLEGRILERNRGFFFFFLQLGLALGQLSKFHGKSHISANLQFAWSRVKKRGLVTEEQLCRRRTVHTLHECSLRIQLAREQQSKVLIAQGEGDSCVVGLSLYKFALRTSLEINAPGSALTTRTTCYRGEGRGGGGVVEEKRKKDETRKRKPVILK